LFSGQSSYAQSFPVSLQVLEAFNRSQIPWKILKYCFVILDIVHPFRLFSFLSAAFIASRSDCSTHAVLVRNSQAMEKTDLPALNWSCTMRRSFIGIRFTPAPSASSWPADRRSCHRVVFGIPQLFYARPSRILLPSKPLDNGDTLAESSSLPSLGGFCWLIGLLEYVRLARVEFALHAFDDPIAKPSHHDTFKRLDFKNRLAVLKFC